MSDQSPLQPPIQPLVDPAAWQEGAADEGSDGEDKPKKDKKPGSDRGVETLFRVTYQNHIQLSQLADNKANMLISINGIIISVLIAVVTPRLAAPTPLLVPALVLILGCMASLTFAVVAARPRITHHPVSLEEVRANRGNLLFFAQFVNMPVEEFQEGMRALMKDRRLLYDNLSREVYYMGRVLVRKYRYVQVAYAIFLVATGLAVLVFVAVLAPQLL